MNKCKSIFEIIEEAKQAIQENHKQEKKLHKVIQKPFIKNKALLNCAMFLMVALLCYAFSSIFMMLFGVGTGIKWATDIAKETSRETITTALHTISLIIGFLVGRKVGQFEGKNKDEFED